MKIAFISQPWNIMVLPVQSGSIAIWTYEVARRLVQCCDFIVYSRRDGFQKKIEMDNGVLYRRVSIPGDQRLLRGLRRLRGFGRLLRLFERLNLPNAERPHFASDSFYLEYIKEVARDLKEQKCDIVHIHNFSQFAPVVRALNPKVKIVLHMHCEWLTQLDRRMIARRLEAVDLVIGCSDYIIQKIREKFPEFASRYRSLHNGVNPDYFAPPADQHVANEDGIRRLLFVARVSPEKGIHVLLDALQKVVIRYPSVLLNIVGPKGSMPADFAVALSDDPKTQDLAEFYSKGYMSCLDNKLSADLLNKVTFRDFVPYTELINYYRRADLFIFPPVWHEPFGMPVIEAMACGMPVVATRSGGITEIIKDGETGLLVERANSDMLAEAIIHLLENQELRESMGNAARKRAVELFSWDRVSENLLSYYKKIHQNCK